MPLDGTDFELWHRMDRYVVFTTTVLGEIDVALVPVAALLDQTQ